MDAFSLASHIERIEADMKKALIIGAAGFVGNYLASQILSEGKWSLAATKMKHETMLRDDMEIYDLDLLEPGAVQSLLEQLRPDYIFHLAAQSSVAVSWKNPGLTVDVNIKGTLAVLDAVRQLDYKPRILLIGSGEEYGHVEPEEIPIRETVCPRPGNIYAATKACQNMIGKIYADAYGIDLMSVRAFNHIGPNQAPLFVVADFCKQAAEIEKGIRPPVMNVGNLAAKRDFTDVRDVVRAYILLMEKGTAGETYNVGSGHAISIEEVLKEILSFVRVTIDVKTDPNKFRPVDVPIIEADIKKLQEATGWRPEIGLRETLPETLRWPPIEALSPKPTPPCIPAAIPIDFDLVVALEKPSVFPSV